MDCGRLALERFITLIVASVSLLMAGQASAVPLYTVTNFGAAVPVSIDSAGNVLLTSGTNGPYNGVYHSFGASSGQITPLSAYGLPPTPPVPVLAEPQPYVTAITDSGAIVGQTTVGNTGQAFIASNGQVTDLGLLPGFSVTQATAANASGTVIGQAYNVGSNPATVNPADGGFIDQNGHLTNIGTLGGSFTSPAAINNSGQVTGVSNGHAFLYQNGTMTDLGTFGGTSSGGTAINNQGQVVGTYGLGYNAAGAYVEHAFLYSNGKMLDLGTLPGSPQSEATGINDSSQVVGNSGYSFLWQNGTMYNLNNLLKTPLPFSIVEVTAINDLGQIIGFNVSNGDSTGFLLTPDNLPSPGYIAPAIETPVPEPSTLVFFGLIALVGILRQRARRSITPAAT